MSILTTKDADVNVVDSPKELTGEDVLREVRAHLNNLKEDVVKVLLHNLLDTCLNKELSSDHLQLEMTIQDFTAYVNYRGDQVRNLLLSYGPSYKDFIEEKQILRDEIENFINNAETLRYATVGSNNTEEMIKVIKLYL